MAEPVLILDLTQVHSSFGKVPNSWCFGPQIKGHYYISLLTNHAVMNQFGRSHWRALYSVDSYKISNGESWPWLNALRTSTHPETHDAVRQGPWCAKKQNKMETDLLWDRRSWSPKLTYSKTSIFASSLKDIHHYSVNAELLRIDE
jgi:hypothetical protein